MPHVSANLWLLRSCLRKRPFPTEEAARSAENSDNFEPYLCPACKKWHRRSKPHFKAATLRSKNIRRQKLRIAALRKRDMMKQYAAAD